MPALYPNLLQHQGLLLKHTAWHMNNVPCTSLLYHLKAENNSWPWEQVHHSTLLESKHRFRISVNYGSNGDCKSCVWGRELIPYHSKGSGCMISVIQEWLIATYLYCITMFTGKNASNLNTNGVIWFTSSDLCPKPGVTKGLKSVPRLYNSLSWLHMQYWYCFHQYLGFSAGEAEPYHLFHLSKYSSSRGMYSCSFIKFYKYL